MSLFCSGELFLLLEEWLRAYIHCYLRAVRWLFLLRLLYRWCTYSVNTWSVMMRYDGAVPVFWFIVVLLLGTFTVRFDCWYCSVLLPLRYRWEFRWCSAILLPFKFFALVRWLLWPSRCCLSATLRCQFRLPICSGVFWSVVAVWYVTVASTFQTCIVPSQVIFVVVVWWGVYADGGRKMEDCYGTYFAMRCCIDSRWCIPWKTYRTYRMPFTLLLYTGIVPVYHVAVHIEKALLMMLLMAIHWLLQVQVHATCLFWWWCYNVHAMRWRCFACAIWCSLYDGILIMMFDDVTADYAWCTLPGVCYVCLPLPFAWAGEHN
jgi:hypothetical protein